MNRFNINSAHELIEALMDATSQAEDTKVDMSVVYVSEFDKFVVMPSNPPVHEYGWVGVMEVTATVV
jgi:16S rRNA G1207 methylase RsmC